MSPRSKMQYKVIREEKRNLIMNVALEHFASDGFHGTTINHIAKHAGISKGLMYNYFRSKEELLSEIINRSVSEIYNNFDIDRDGYLSEEEFEIFVRKVSLLLKEKRSIWRLFFQLLMQREVREIFIDSYMNADSPALIKADSHGRLMEDISKMFKEYFFRKGSRMPDDYDPDTEFEMFIHTFKGFTLSAVFDDTIDTGRYVRTIERIIETYK